SGPGSAASTTTPGYSGALQTTVSQAIGRTVRAVIGLAVRSTRTSPRATAAMTAMVSAAMTTRIARARAGASATWIAEPAHGPRHWAAAVAQAAVSATIR